MTTEQPVSKQTEQKLMQLQLLEQSIQNILTQKQQFSGQLLEIENALKEVKQVQNAYKIVGNIMVLTKQKDLMEDLQQKQDLITVRIQSLERQEKKLREKATSLQEEVVSKLKSTETQNGQ